MNVYAQEIGEDQKQQMSPVDQVRHALDLDLIPISGIPQVAFDPQLGKRYSHVDFDFDKYRGQITELGGTEEDYACARVLIKHSRNPLLGGDAGGEYIVVNAGRRANDALAHETLHNLENRRGETHMARTVTGNLSYVVLMANSGLLGAAYGVAGVGRIIPNKLSQTTAELLPYQVVAEVAAAAIYGVLYAAAPHERRARAAGRAHAGDGVITLEKRR